MKIIYRIFPEAKGIAFSFFIFITFLILNGCSSSLNDRRSSESSFSITNLKANLEFLSSDELEGREAATKGEKLAAMFIASELKKYGVKPYYKEYLQEYNLNSISAAPESVVKIINTNGEKITLIYSDDFLADRRNSVTTTGNYKLVFAGYGISAPEYNYNDYNNLNVKNKIVLIADDEPFSTDSSYFEGEIRSKYSRDSFKVSLAKSLGAAGIIKIPSDRYLKNWERFKFFVKGESFSLNNSEEGNLLNLLFNEESLTLLLNDEEYSFADLKNMIDDNKPLPAFEINKDIEINVKINSGNRKSYNIVGIIEGNDPLKKDEYVAIGAHYDHLGIINGEVYNGADDNGSGTAALLEVARVFAETGINQRSILIVFHGAEEKGLLGSEYFTDNFEYINNISAHINMDMIGRGHIDTIYSVGSGKISREFQELVEQVNSETSNFVFNYRFDDPSDRQRIYYRSDHYNYAKHGIPIVFFYDYMTDDYHKHSDEVDKINFEKIRKAVILVYNIALRTANLNKKFRKENQI